eukprot:Unigene10717_Nuclearia_a/m.32770 Unigene10717_Nuclearia_a/g.32770  ORF Unigene10717_Nuclearia_a/g.32770 Unigene10717_Nuclearia_a/m.32770 type:complete len:445 (-) Unigene10717_Nuclearia_a:60-1394(-)
MDDGLKALLLPAGAGVEASPYVRMRACTNSVSPSRRRKSPARTVDADLPKRLNFAEDAAVTARALTEAEAEDDDTRALKAALGTPERSASTVLPLRARDVQPADAGGSSRDSNTLKRLLGLRTTADGSETVSLRDVPTKFVRAAAPHDEDDAIGEGAGEAAPEATPVRPLAFEQLSPRERMLYKTNMCHTEERQPGSCPFGAACLNAHTRAELRPDPTWRTELCKSKYVRGHCSFGKQCKYAHSEDELQQLPLELAPKSWKGKGYKTELCNAFRKHGFCPYGSRCWHVHDRSELVRPGEPDRDAGEGQQHRWTMSEIIREADRQDDLDADAVDHENADADDDRPELPPPPPPPEHDWDEELARLRAAATVPAQGTATQRARRNASPASPALLSQMMLPPRDPRRGSKHASGTPSLTLVAFVLLAGLLAAVAVFLRAQQGALVAA